MKKHVSIASIPVTKLVLVAFAALVMVGLFAVGPKQIKPFTGMASAACLSTAPPTTYGKVTQTVTVATAGTYRVWSRIKAPDTTNNSYYFQVDGGCAYDIGDAASIPANTWTWVNYQDGATASTVSVALTAGSHTLTYTGKEPNVELDKVMLLTDTSCVPTTLGTNCAVNDTTSPTVSLTAPANGATVTGTSTITATATDASGISKVEFYVDGVLKSTDTTAAYSYAWDTTTATNATHSLQVKAYDTSGNVGSSATTTVTVKNGTSPGNDTTPPTVSLTAPTAGSSVAVGAAVTINATASDNVAVTRVEFYQSGVLLGTDTTSPYSYSWTTTGAAAGAHALTAKAYDAAGNVTTSSAVSVTLTGGSGTVTGDVNGDGRVNALDLSALISHDGQNYPAADFNHDGTVGAADLAIMLSKWTW